MSTHRQHWLRRGIVVAVLWGSTVCAWAQVEKIASRIEELGPTQQRQLQALMASRQERGGAQLFTDEEVRTVRAAVPTAVTPLPKSDIDQLSLRIHNVFGSRGNYMDRIVSGDPVFPVCPGCNDGLGKTCHQSSSQSRRATASSLLTQRPHLVEAVGGLYLIQVDSPPQLMGTVFVLQGRIVTNGHVLLNATQPTGSADVRKLKPQYRLEAVFGAGGVRRVVLPADSPWRRHPSLDLIVTAWPVGAVAPMGLTLATGTLATSTSVALLGFPSVNNNTDRPEDVDRVFGRCPEVPVSEPSMVISMGQITSVSDVTLEHDANTMGNSSGSPLIRMADGLVVGVQRADGLSSDRNLAVVASGLAELVLAAAP